MISIYLREFVYELPSSWPPARVEGGSGLQSMTPDWLDPRDPGESSIVPGGLLLSNTHTLSAYWQVQDGFGWFLGQNSPKSIKNHQNTYLFARDRRFCREKTAGGRLLRKPHTCQQRRHRHCQQRRHRHCQQRRHRHSLTSQSQRPQHARSAAARMS